jgi:NAD(P)-dependent dehydrogenase (short-subunit alcohol dehydrogenase family)
MENRKAAIVSGGATGIGRASAVGLAEHGYNSIVIADWKKEEGEAAAGMCRDKGAEAYFCYTDMGKEKEVIDMVAFTVEKFGRVDFFFNNHGVLHMPAHLDEITEEVVDYTLSSNLKGAFFGMKHVLKVMKEQKFGHIVNTCSTNSFRHEGGFGIYTASKHALAGLTKAAAMEYGVYNVKVNAVCPGSTLTPMVMAVGEWFQTHSDFKSTSPGNLARIEGMAMPEEIAAMVVLLATYPDLHVTGSLIRMDQGLGL